MLMKKLSATSVAVSVVWEGMKCTLLEGLSTQVVMQSKPRFVLGNLTMKFVARDPHRREGMSRDVGSVYFLLLR